MTRKAIRAMEKLSGRVFIDTCNASNTVFLAGSGRSGTTWLEEILNYDNSFRVMFEPFHSIKVDILKGWNYRQYLRADNTDPIFMGPASRILRGDIHNSWIDQYNHKPMAGSRIIKDIRANLLLKWISKNFPDIFIVFMVRHPCAVANSRIRLGWDTHLNDFIIQDDLVTDFLQPYREEIEAAADIFEKNIFMWCIENYVPLKQFGSDDMVVVFYENMCLNPENEIENVFNFIGKSFSSKVSSKIGKASPVSRKDSAINSGSNLVSSWRKHITESQIRRAVDILSLFGMDKIYNESDFPLVNGDEALKMFSPTS
jgi:hypothetical protein